MNCRILGPEEWPKVEGLRMSKLIELSAPENIAVVVVEDGEEIIGVLAVLQVTHLEGLWVKPERRNGLVLRPLLRQALALARVRNESWVLGGAEDGDETMDGLIGRCGGVKLPLRFYQMPTNGGH